MSKGLVAVTERTEEVDRRAMREAFVKDLYLYLSDKNVTHRELRDAVPGISAHTEIQRWRHGIAEPPPNVVFAIEDYLDLKPGSLSIHLGYLPPKVQPAPKNLVAMIEGDDRLPAWGKEILLTAYREIMRSLEGHTRRR